LLGRLNTTRVISASLGSAPFARVRAGSGREERKVLIGTWSKRVRAKELGKKKTRRKKARGSWKAANPKKKDQNSKRDKV